MTNGAICAYGCIALMLEMLETCLLENSKQIQCT